MKVVSIISCKTSDPSIKKLGIGNIFVYLEGSQCSQLFNSAAFGEILFTSKAEKLETEAQSFTYLKKKNNKQSEFSRIPQICTCTCHRCSVILGTAHKGSAC